MKNIFLTLCLISASLVFSQSPKRILKKIGNDPLFYVDSVNVSKEDILNYDPKDISSITVFKEKTAIEKFGEEGKDGVIFIQTKVFCKKRYWIYFSSKSEEYKQNVPSPLDDFNVQYIINDRVLDGNSEGDLASIDDSIFKSIQFLTKQELIETYNVTDKDFGFRIISDIPKDLYHGKKKF
jgi:hypothetical protein